MQWLYVFFVLAPIACESVEILPQNLTSTPCTDNNHLFLAPGVLAAGGSNKACISRFHPDGVANLVVTLLTEDRETTTSVKELPPGDGGCIEITVPQKPNTKATLTVELRYPNYQCSWERSMTVHIASGSVLVIHSERARYRPGESLRARVLVLKADLTPISGVIDEIWLEGPQGAWAGTRAAQWQQVRTHKGIAQIQHEIDELAPPGRWTIRASLADGTQGAAAFMVGHYELPPFQLSVQHAQKVLRSSHRLVWTVCVRYPWKEAVEGMLVIRIRGAGGNNVLQESGSGIKTVVEIKAPRTCHRHAAAARRIGLNGTNPPDIIVADFSFQEEGTSIWQNTTVVSQVVDKPISLEFMMKHRAVISPRLPYKLKVKATRWDDKPGANERIRVCRESTRWPLSNSKWPTNSNSTCFDADTDKWGEARVTFTASDDGSSYYIFKASVLNDSSISAPPLRIPAASWGSAQAALGPIKPNADNSETLVPLYINLDRIDRPLTVHYVVITRGSNIHRWGATTQCPSTGSSNYIPLTSRNSKCYNSQINVDGKWPKYSSNRPLYGMNSAISASNSLDYGTNPTIYGTNSSKLDSDSLLDRHLRVMLLINITHKMCPDSHLIAYFYYNGELISANKHFEMDGCFNNKVEIAWVARNVTPGSIASLKVSSPGPALCALTVLDTAIRRNQPASSVKEEVLTALRKLMDNHRNLTEFDVSGNCFLSSDIPELPSKSQELTAIWFALAGIRALGGGVTDPRASCFPPPAALIDDATVPRSDFSEAWLWRLSVLANGSAVVSGRAPDSISRFEASAICLSKTGIAVSSPAAIQVFREFFIHADSPRRLKRGESTIVRYRLFNHLYKSLSVQIQFLTDSHLEGPSEHVEATCVSARASVARRVEVFAKESGVAQLSIRAKSVQDGSCGNVTVAREGVSDEVIIKITVEPEGIPEQEHKSILLCGRDSKESKKSEISWSWLKVDTVPGTETLTVWATGDINGPLLADADALVRLPRGCGEQNMARLATNLLALTQLQPGSPAAAVAKEHVRRGFTRQLQYVHSDGGFSAFGSADDTPSTWLTAFCLRYLRRAHQILSPDLPIPPVIERAERWLLDQQMENGCFRNIGQVFHREFKGDINEEEEVATVALAAYVITALLDSTSLLPLKVIQNSLVCLRALPQGKIRSPAKVYSQALLGYAFVRIRAYEDELIKTNEVSQWNRRRVANLGLKETEEMQEMVELLKIARRTDDYVWWETSSLSTSIEATGYALLALSLSPKLLSSSSHDARGASRWLSSHRNPQGGFLSTQDTLVALEALTAWSSVQPAAPTNLTVKTTTGAYSKTIKIKPSDKIPEVIPMGSGDHLNVAVEGTGCALVQATRSYNRLTPAAPRSEVLRVQVAVTTNGPFDCDRNNTNCLCDAEIEACVWWARGFPEMALLEIWLPSAMTADAALLYSQLTPDDPLLRRIELSASGNRATLYLSPRTPLPRAASACYRVHAAGPRARTRPARVRLLDYYSPATNHSQMYTIPEDCPPRNPPKTDDFVKSDNLFSRARSLTDSGEIVITHDFSLKDIPEGLPIEYPLFDAYNRDEFAYLSKPDIGHDPEPNHNSPTIYLKQEEKNHMAPDLVENLALLNNATENNTDVSNENENYKYGTENLIRNSTQVQEVDVNDTLAQASSFSENVETNNFGETQSKDVVIDDKEKHDFNEIYFPADNYRIKPTNNEERLDYDPTNVIKPNNDRVVSITDFLKKGQGYSNEKVENPNLSHFHVIDTEGDLEVPSGVEGPIPSVVLPPPNFVPPVATPDYPPRTNTNSYARGFPIRPQDLYYYCTYYFPYYHQNLHAPRTYNAPAG